MSAAQQPCLPFDREVGDRFEEFHAANPIVYTTLVRLAREWKEKFGGGAKVGLAALRERARWEIAFVTSDTDYKINNNYTPFYARLIMAENPDLAGLFDLRYSEADQWIQTYRPHQQKAAAAS